MEQVATLMFQVPGGGGYNMNYDDVMALDVEWKNFLIEYANESFDEYAREMESKS